MNGKIHNIRYMLKILRSWKTFLAHSENPFRFCIIARWSDFERVFRAYGERWVWAEWRVWWIGFGEECSATQLRSTWHKIDKIIPFAYTWNTPWCVSYSRWILLIWHFSILMIPFGGRKGLAKPSTFQSLTQSERHGFSFTMKKKGKSPPFK